MLAFSNDYYGMIFRATQSVELFCAYLKMTFAGRNFEIIFYNKEKKEFNQLKIRKAACDGKALEITAERCTILSKREIQMLSAKETHKIEIELV